MYVHIFIYWDKEYLRNTGSIWYFMFTTSFRTYHIWICAKSLGYIETYIFLLFILITWYVYLHTRRCWSVGMHMISMYLHDRVSAYIIYKLRYYSILVIKQAPNKCIMLAPYQPTLWFWLNIMIYDLLT